MNSKVLFSTLLVLTNAVAACSSMPSNGPTAASIIEVNASVSDHNIDVVSLNDRNIDTGLHEGDKKWTFKAGRSEFISKIKPSDTLVVRIWEANPDGLFSSPENPAPPMEVTVSPEGTIFIPYAGEVNVEGLSPRSVRHNILNELQGKVIDPQVQVELRHSRLSTVSIAGGVGRPGQYELVEGNAELLKILSQAGGVATDSFETEVSIIRSGKKHSLFLSDVIDTSSNNVEVLPGDVINIDYRPATFTAFGAVQNGGLIQFSTADMTLEKAIAKAGGLRDNTARASGVFLYRNIKIDDTPKPTIFRLDMTEPDSFFKARSFKIERDDILYVANATAADLNKFITTLIGPITRTAENINTIKN